MSDSEELNPDVIGSDDQNDEFITPEDGAGPDAADLEHQELALVYNQPYRIFQTATGKNLPVWPKTPGYLFLIDEERREYFRTADKYARKTVPKWWAVWFLGRFRSWRRKHWMDRTYDALYRTLVLIFEDQYIPERHTEFTREDIWQTPGDVIHAIFDAFEEANSVQGLAGKLAIKKKAAADG